MKSRNNRLLSAHQGILVERKLSIHGERMDKAVEVLFNEIVATDVENWPGEILACILSLVEDMGNGPTGRMILLSYLAEGCRTAAKVKRCTDAELKAELLELAKSGAPRPKRGTILGDALHRFTTKPKKPCKR